MPEQKTKEQLAAEAKAKADAAAKAAEEKAIADKAAALKKSNDTPVLKKTKDNYVPEPGTEGDYHCKIERVAFKSADGTRQSTPRVQYFDPKGFRNFAAHAAGQGWTVDILHDPTGKYPVVGVAAAKEAAKAKADAKK